MGNEKCVGQKNTELIFETLHLIRKSKFRIFNFMTVIFIPHVILFSGHSQSLIPHFSKNLKAISFLSFLFKASFEHKSNPLKNSMMSSM